MKKKGKLMALVSVMSMLFIAGCNDDNGEEGITLDFWTNQLEPTYTEYLEELINEYEEQNPEVTINWLDVPADDLEEKVLADVSSGNEPDVVNLDPSFASSLADVNATINMDEYVSEEDRDQYLDNAWEANQIDGETFAIPWYLGTAVTHYNKGIFEEADLDPEQPPETFEEAKEYAEVIDEETDAYGYFPSMDGTLSLQYMEQWGVSVTNDDGTAAFNTPEGVEVLDYFTELYENGLIPSESLTGEEREGTNFYQAGEVAFGGFILNEVEENAPDIYDNTGVSDQITGEAEVKDLIVQNIVVPEPSDHHEEAVDFALFITNPENQLEFAQIAGSGVLPSTEETLEDPYFSEVPENATVTDLVRVTEAEQLPDAELLVPPMENLNELTTIMHDAFSKAMLGETTSEEALAEAEEEWNNVVSE
ncbi:sugar ABC transporter substrate-binding protein [Virgibacillus sp. NKC19-3]|uniref:ABC transporter substrate-binding protein n=1 Tax=Virgibacillus saliphilus TaxID=2831674 RepID=UPI001C9BB277|nr:sugar ABC transporter substrate-binding protein [Virgibacillus sp. NKC19-3]MBY7142898.1 sugar ABC transporter substrate-binding protein [Virgibacillus sp. NKC19-3]